MTVVSMMKVPAIVGAALVAVLLVAGPAAAQGKDPFRPPTGSGGSAATGGSPAESGPILVPSEPRTSGDLPRTGLDLSIPVLTAGALIAAGASMRLTTSALTH
jgi:hypothetical protein